ILSIPFIIHFGLLRMYCCLGVKFLKLIFLEYLIKLSLSPAILCCKAKEYLFKSRYFFKEGLYFSSTKKLSGFINTRFFVGVWDILLLPCKLCCAVIIVENASELFKAARIQRSVSSPAPFVIVVSKPFKSKKKSFFMLTADVHASASIKLFSK